MRLKGVVGERGRGGWDLSSATNNVLKSRLPLGNGGIKK